MTLLREEVPVALVGPEPGYDVLVTPEVVDGQTIYVASNPALPHVRSQGGTPSEALASLDEVREAFLSDMSDSGIAVPPPKLDPRVEILADAAASATTWSHSESPATEPIAWEVTVRPLLAS